MAEMMAFPPASHATLKMGHPWELCRGSHGSAGEFLTVYVKPVSRRGLQKRCSSTSGWYLRAASCHAGPCYAVLCYTASGFTPPCYGEPCSVYPTPAADMKHSIFCEFDSQCVLQPILRTSVEDLCHILPCCA